MKTSIYRILINWYQASDRDLPAWLERACEKDESLLSEKCFGEELTRELQKLPNDSTSFGEDRLAARVLKQIAEEDYLADQAKEDFPAWGTWVRNAGMAVAALAVVVAGYQYLDTDKEVGAEVATVESSPATDDLIDIPKDWKNPLDQEIEYIVSDAKGALGFLANNFVPSSYLEEEDNA